LFSGRTDQNALREDLAERRQPSEIYVGEPLALAMEEDKYEDDIQNLIEAGKEKGYLTYNEVNDLIPGDMHSPDDLDDLITTIGTQGIDILEGGPKFGGDKFDEGEEGAREDQRPRAHVPARDGHCSPAHPRGRS
jgi:hypothetical protein